MEFLTCSKVICVQALGNILFISETPSQEVTFVAICSPFLFLSSVPYVVVAVGFFLEFLRFFFFKFFIID